MSQTLSEILSRIEAGSGPDWELERDVWEALTGECVHRNAYFVELESDERELECSDCGVDTYGADKWSGLTRSLDDCLALMERDLPDVFWRVQKQSADYGIAPFFAVCGPHGKPQQQQVGHGASPARALLAAILKARMSGL